MQPGEGERTNDGCSADDRRCHRRSCNVCEAAVAGFQEVGHQCRHAGPVIGANAAQRQVVRLSSQRRVLPSTNTTRLGLTEARTLRWSTTPPRTAIPSAWWRAKTCSVRASRSGSSNPLAIMTV